MLCLQFKKKKKNFPLKVVLERQLAKKNLMHLTLKNLKLFDAKDPFKNLVVESNMEEGILIPVQLKLIVNLVATTPSLTVAIVDPWIDVRVEET
jgi:hypothetical protein